MTYQTYMRIQAATIGLLGKVARAIFGGNADAIVVTALAPVFRALITTLRGYTLKK